MQAASRILGTLVANCLFQSFGQIIYCYRLRFGGFPLSLFRLPVVDRLDSLNLES